MTINKLQVGTKILSASRTVTESDIIFFAGLTGDYHPVHTNELHVSRNPFVSRRVAHGLLVLGISEGLFFRTNFFDWENEPLLSLGFDNMKFRKPVFVGDTIRSEFTVARIRDSNSRPGSRIITVKGECKNQRGELVCEYEHPLIVTMKDG